MAKQEAWVPVVILFAKKELIIQTAQTAAETRMQGRQVLVRAARSHGSHIG
jgi:hypothetical protein